ncbi:MAG: SPOR domain-containing protein [Gemmatimonadales bacterium]|nr:SPOR domain-containing protein [Gemmatimonadales bacterium]MYC89338.1 SPOR domain-containing protein [Candidatus Palauibacter denitrificans]
MSAGGPAPFTWGLPADARIVALVFQRSEAERSATAVDAIATSIARRRGRTFVLNSEAGPSPLDELAGASERADAGGMAGFLGGQSGLAGIAVRRADCPYVYLPAGQVPEGVVGLLESAALERFVSHVKERGGTLFIAMSDRRRPSPGLLGLLDGYIAVGRVPPEDHGMQCYGHVPFEAGESDELSAAPEAAPEEDAAEPTPEPEAQPEIESPPEPEPRLESEFRPAPAPQPSLEPEPDAAAADLRPTPEPAPGKARGRRRRAPLVAALVIAALAVGNWWAYRNGWFDRAISRVGSMIAARQEVPATPVTPPEDGPATQAAGTPDDTSAGDTPSDDTSSDDIPPDDIPPEDLPQAPDESAVAAAFESAGGRPYSVLLGSFRDPAEAAERVAEIRALHGAVLYVMAPTTIRDVLYQRILAGAVASEAEASALLDQLVAVGVAEEANTWLLRPVRFAYDLGAFADRQEVELRIAQLAALGIPAYSLETALDGMPVFRVYGGAYENEEAAAPMRDLLEAAGETATLIERRGAAAPSAP